MLPGETRQRFVTSHRYHDHIDTNFFSSTLSALPSLALSRALTRARLSRVVVHRDSLLVLLVGLVGARVSRLSPLLGIRSKHIYRFLRPLLGRRSRGPPNAGRTV